MGRKPKEISITKIAMEAGVSVSTVSRAMNSRASVSEETRKKINELMKKYNFIPTPAVQREKKIALLVGSNRFNDYVSEVFNGIYKYTEANSLETTLIFKKEYSRYSLLEQIRDQQCSGIVVIVPADFSDSLAALAESELPVVLIDEAVYRKGLGFIDHDSYSGSREAVKYLLELNHRNIGYIECNRQTINHIQRFKAYENTMKEAGITPDPQWHIFTESDANTYRTSFLKMQELLGRAPELTAVMTSNDTIAIGAMKGALETGRRIPEDISIIGFDNYKQTEFLNPALTTVNHPIEEAGFLAAKSIDQCLKNPQVTQLPQEILPTSLLIRGSTAFRRPY